MLKCIFLPSLFLARNAWLLGEQQLQGDCGGRGAIPVWHAVYGQGFKAYNGGALQRLASARTDRLWKSWPSALSVPR